LFKRHRLIALQLEVTSRCTRQCAICPRSALISVWQDGDLGDSTWDRLRQDLGLARHVHLQGWGEPLLHPRLPEMVDAAKVAGCTVGITTNGDLLEDAVDWIVNRGVNIITVSVAGDETTHATLRSGSRLEDLWAAVRRLVARRGSRKLPRVKVGFLLTKQSCEQVTGLVEVAAAAGADEIFLTHLDCTPSRELLDAAAFDATGTHPGVAEAIEAASRVARSLKIKFRAPALARQELLICALDPLSMAFVSWDGRVGPCVNLGLPVEGPIPRWSENASTPVDPVFYGDLAESSLGEILRSERFRSFTESFKSRLSIERRFLDGVVSRSGAEALAYLDEADRRRENGLAAHSFPGPCAGCHKVVGW
jgi:MoaA/NifB/PqqE/SkfB family radical SAM enzyme